jgi:AraC-like DNA-binding protein
MSRCVHHGIDGRSAMTGPRSSRGRAQTRFARPMRSRAGPPLGRHVAFRSSDLDETKRQLAAHLPLRRLEFATDDQRLDARLHVVRLPHLALMYLSYGGEVVAVLGGPASGFLVHMPLAGGLGIKSGRHDVQATPALAAVASPGDSITTTWDRAGSALVLRIEPQALESELADSIDGVVDETLRFQLEMDLTKDAVRSWFELTRFVADELDGGAGLIDHPLIALHIERALLRGLLLCQPNSYTVRLRDDRRGNVPAHVAAAMRVMEDQPSRSFSATGLARAVGVSARALQEGFRQHLGVTPMQFLRGVRLQRVRRDLLAGDPEAGVTVAETAFRWGFTHLGRFASYYRSRYGEAPSQTLRGSPSR